MHEVIKSCCVGRFFFGLVRRTDYPNKLTYYVEFFTVDADAIWKDWSFQSLADAEAQLVRMVEMCEITTGIKAVENAW